NSAARWVEQESLGSAVGLEGELEERLHAPLDLAEAHLRMSGAPRRELDRDFADREAVPVEDEQALEEEGVPAGLHEAEDLARDRLHVVDPEGPRRVVAHAEEPLGEDVAELREHLPEEAPSGEALGPD